MTSSSRHLAVALALLATLCARPAAANKVFVAVVPGTEDVQLDAAAAGGWMEAAVLKERARTLVTADAKVREGAVPDRLEATTGAAALNVSGNRNFITRKYAEAVADFEQAIGLWEKADLRYGIDGLCEALAAKALAHLALNQKAHAETELARLFLLRPDYKFDPSRLNNTSKPVLGAARKAAQSKKAATLKVKTTPNPAVMFLDGVAVAVTPAEIPNVPPGQHLVAFVAPGFAQTQTRVSPGFGLTVPLVKAPGAAHYAELLQKLGQELATGKGEVPAKALAQWAQADIVVAAVLVPWAAGMKVTAVVVDSDGQRRASETREIAQGAEGKAAFEALTRDLLASSVALPAKVAAAAPPPPKAAPAPPPPAPKVVEAAAPEPTIELPQPEAAPVEQQAAVATGEGLSRKTLGWILIGSGGAAALGGTVLGLKVRSTAEQARNTPQVDEDQYNQLVSSGKTMMYVTDALFVAALASAATGGYLLWTAPAAAPAATTTSLNPVPGGAMLSLQGRF